MPASFPWWTIPPSLLASSSLDFLALKPDMLVGSIEQDWLWPMTANDTHPDNGRSEDPLFENPENVPETVDLEILRAENADLKDKVLRGLAELENLRRRAERDRAEATLYAATNFARDLLSVADNFSRALSALSPEQKAAADTSVQNLISGIEVTERELMQVFERYQIRRLDPVGEKFDPHMHQAMFEVPTAETPSGFVVQVMQPGYAIGDRCLRPALVGVAKTP